MVGSPRWSSGAVPRLRLEPLAGCCGRHRRRPEEPEAAGGGPDQPGAGGRGGLASCRRRSSFAVHSALRAVEPSPRCVYMDAQRARRAEVSALRTVNRARAPLRARRASHTATCTPTTCWRPCRPPPAVAPPAEGWAAVAAEGRATVQGPAAGGMGHPPRFCATWARRSRTARCRRGRGRGPGAWGARPTVAAEPGLSPHQRGAHGACCEGAQGCHGGWGWPGPEAAGPGAVAGGGRP